MRPRGPRSPAEWVSLAGSAVVLLAFVVLILAQIPGNDRPAAPTARVEGVREVADTFHVDVVVENLGDLTAADVQVIAELTLADSTLTGEQTIDFLSGGEDRDLVFIFDEDPASGELTTRIGGYAVP